MIDSTRCVEPLLWWDHMPAAPPKASALAVSPCPPAYARKLNELWHSRLPRTQVGPWQFAFHAHFDHLTYGVALWHNPSARTLPHHWVELRRLAVAPDAPHCTATRMLGQMAKWFAANHPERERLISYQDTAVHKGTIYLAAGWEPAHRSTPRTRDRSVGRKGTARAYRSNQNGVDVDSTAKVRWELDISRKQAA